MAAIDQNKIRKTSQIIRAFAIAILIAVPLLLAWYWSDPFNSISAQLGLTINSEMRLIDDLVAGGYLTPESLTLKMKVLGFFISSLPMAFFLLTIFQVYRLMGHFSKGRYITSKTVRALKLASVGLLLYAPMAILSEPLLTLALTLGNPEGYRIFSIGVGSTEIIALFLGAFLLMITRAFNVEKERAEEHASIV